MFDTANALDGDAKAWFAAATPAGKLTVRILLGIGNAVAAGCKTRKGTSEPQNKGMSAAWQTSAARHGACLPGGVCGRALSDVPRSVECVAAMSEQARRDLYALAPSTAPVPEDKINWSQAADNMRGNLGPATRLAGPRVAKGDKVKASNMAETAGIALVFAL